MNFTLKVWRQSQKDMDGYFEEYPARDISPNASLMEMLDIVNNQLAHEGKTPIAFDHDCREGICGTCSLFINGEPHGPEDRITSCQTYMRNFKEGQTIIIEPFRAQAFPILRDLITDRSAFDRIMQAGGFVSVSTGQAPEANNIPIPKDTAENAFDAAHCIGCGACVAACKNGSAMLFVSAKVTHLGLLPQGQPERDRRVLAMVEAMEEEGFGGCTNTKACEAACPKGISVANIARMNRDYLTATVKEIFVNAPPSTEGGG